MVSESEIKRWESDQRLCEIADAFLRVLVEKQVSVRESLRVVKKMKDTIKWSSRVARWDVPLACGVAQNEGCAFSINQEQLDRRKNESNGVGDQGH